MKTYNFTWTETHYMSVSVEAANESAAKKKFYEHEQYEANTDDAEMNRESVAIQEVE